MASNTSRETEIAKRLSKFSDAEVVERWHGIVEIVKAELTSLNLQRQFMQETIDIVNRNPRFLHHPGRRFMDYVRVWYGTAMAAAYRRQNDGDSRSASLRVLLDEIKSRPRAYRVETLRRYMGAAPDEDIEALVMCVVGARGASGPDIAIVQGDLDALATVGERIHEYVNKHVAHTDIEAQKTPLEATFDEIHAAAKRCEEIAARWVTALTGPAYSFDVVTQYGWHDVFDFPWCASKASP